MSLAIVDSTSFSASWLEAARSAVMPPSTTSTQPADGNPCDDEACVAPTGPTTLYANGGDASAIDPNDIKQGGIGDCYFLASVAALAEQDPEAIQNMIKDNGDGTYTVTFYEKDNGFLGIPGLFGGGSYEKREVTVDGTFPGNGKGANASGDVDANGQQEIWPQVLEKAYAEYHGGFSNISGGGDPSAALAELTGSETSASSPSDVSIEQISQDLADGKAVVVWTPSSLSKDSSGNTPFGLHESHAYTVTGAYKDADGQWQLELRNPWGYDDPQTIPASDYASVLSGVSSATVH